MTDGAAGSGEDEEESAGPDDPDDPAGLPTPTDRLPETEGPGSAGADAGDGGRQGAKLRTRIAHELTGAVLDGFAVTAHLDAGTVDCTRCGPDDAGRLVAGDRAIVAFTRYEGRTWEPVAVRCPEHAVGRLAEVVDGRAEDQTLVRATLEPTGYRDPLGGDHPDALTLGGIEVLDASPAADGYPD